METGERGKRKNLYSSCFRSAVSVLLLLTVFIVPLSSIDINKPAVGLSSGILVDIAPFGIEQIYFTAQGLYTLPGTLTLSLRPSVSIADSSNMFRIPLVINISGYVGKKEFILISGYFGGGLEVYRSTEHNTESLLLTGGVSIAVGIFYIDIPVVRAHRSYNTDSDIAITAGFYFQR
ncbi:MAG: hypothetical protein KAQ93_01235 [Spirochaetales bacterium]|nr:hypothetical protein [Spirochaetales bacterium]